MQIELKIRQWLLALPRRAKSLIAFAFDIFSMVASVSLAYFLRLGVFLPLTKQTAEHFPLPALVASILIAIPIFLLFGLYRTVFRFLDRASFVLIGGALAVYSAIYIVVFSVVGIDGVPRTIGIIQPAVLFSLMVAVRVVGKFWLSGSYQSHVPRNKRRKILIYGAGAAGRQLAGQLWATEDKQAVAFLDDDVAIHGQQISGLPVFSPSEFRKVSSMHNVDEVLLAIPSVGRKRRNEIIARLQDGSLSVRTLPSYNDLIDGRVQVSDIQDLSIDEVLGRDIVEADKDLMRKDIENKIILVTGAGGSIGSELCRQIMPLNPKRLILFEQNEFALYSIQNELMKMQKTLQADVNLEIVPVLGSITNERLVRFVIEENQVNSIYHAAAYKHVSLVEKNSIEGVWNNVFGTRVIAQAACDLSVGKFVQISTDKAVRPTSMMGASKRVAEMVLQSLSEKNPNTTFAMVRFGNVLDSSGSVVPIFRKQISEGGPVTVTHPEVTRYFMTIAEAAELVIQAGAMTDSTEYFDGIAPVYLLDMGEPVKILDLATQMIALSGLSIFDAATNPEGDIQIKFIGLKPGEKLFEELLIGDAARGTDHKKISVAHETCLPEEELGKLLEDISKSMLENDAGLLYRIFKDSFPLLGASEEQVGEMPASTLSV